MWAYLSNVFLTLTLTPFYIICKYLNSYSKLMILHIAASFISMIRYHVNLYPSTSSTSSRPIPAQGCPVLRGGTWPNPTRPPRRNCACRNPALQRRFSMVLVFKLSTIGTTIEEDSLFNMVFELPTRANFAWQMFLMSPCYCDTVFPLPVSKCIPYGTNALKICHETYLTLTNLNLMWCFIRIFAQPQGLGRRWRVRPAHRWVLWFEVSKKAV